MAWLQYVFNTTLAEKDSLEDALLQAGAVAVTVQSADDEPLFELQPNDRPMWQSIKLTVLTDADLDTETFLLLLNVCYQRAVTPVSKEFIGDKDWTREWMDRFEPIQCGQRLWIVPSWHQAPDTNACNLILDPGLAFGSGTHPTTRMCLEWLDTNIKGDETVLDYGCGSGILAIGALLLGAKSACGTDIDPQAIEASHDNAERNHINPTQFNAYLCEDYPSQENEIVVANILAEPLKGLSDTLVNALGKGGKLILSGILEEQAQQVIDAYQNLISLRCVNLMDGWVLLAGTKTT